ncbi:hypothetical protein [Nakamurella panacisegetis]|uniref:hypothetical protein n=1 Tax=Nakamurella panacisegetis TaxID=1090615 RepID=UPI0018D3740E
MIVAWLCGIGLSGATLLPGTTAPFARRRDLTGFENHSGQTILSDGQQSLGRVVKGWGNNSDGGTEGAITRGAIGTYLQDPSFPRILPSLIICFFPHSAVAT